MPPKKNAKAVAANARKEEQQNEKKAKVMQKIEQTVAEDWAKGAKDLSKKEQEEAKRLEALAKKAEREALLAAEEAALPTKGSAKKASMKDMSLNLGQLDVKYSATGLENAIDLMELATSAKANDQIERHPERRMKSAWAAFEERETPLLKAENPNLRQSQIKQQLQKKWKKSPENPMNQAYIAHDATKEVKRS